MNYLTNINLNKNELQNAVMQPLAVAPSSPKEGQIYYNSGEHLLYVYCGTTLGWKKIGDPSDIPIASESEKGVVKIGVGITIADDGTISVNPFTTDDEAKLDGIEEGAEVNVQSDWNQSNTGADDFIKNKPDLSLKADKSYVDDELEDKVDKVEGKGLSTNDLTDEWAAYLRKQTFKTPSIDTLTLCDASGNNLSTTYEYGPTITVGKIKHKETNISNLTQNTLKFQNVDAITPSESQATADVTDISTSASATYSLSASYVDTVGATKSVSKSASITFYRYAYINVTNATTAPTTGTQKTAVGTFASSGADISYTAGQYIYFYTDGTGKTVQTNVLGQWADVDTTSVGKVTLTQANGYTHEYDCYRIGPFMAGGTDKYRV